MYCIGTNPGVRGPTNSIRRDFCQARANTSTDMLICLSEPARAAASARFSRFRRRHWRSPPSHRILNSKWNRAMSCGRSTVNAPAARRFADVRFAPNVSPTKSSVAKGCTHLTLLGNGTEAHRSLLRAPAPTPADAALSAWPCDNAAIGWQPGSHWHLASCCDQCGSRHPTISSGEWPCRSENTRSQQ